MDFSKFLPKRNPDTNKRDYGSVLVIAGSVRYTGAAYFTSHAAIRTGCGLVTLAVPETVYPILAAKLNEVMVRSFSAIPEGGFSKELYWASRKMQMGQMCLRLALVLGDILRQVY